MAARRSDRGVTLIELLVVLAVMAVLMGLGVSMFVNLGKQGVFSAAVTRVLGTINRVHNSSMSHPAALQVNAGNAEKEPPEENSIRGLEFVTMCQSQCEPPEKGSTDLLGAEGRDGTLPGGVSFRPGVIGMGLFFDQGGGVDFGKHDAYNATEGIAVDLRVYPVAAVPGVLLRRGTGLVLSTTAQADGVGIKWELDFQAGGVALGKDDPAASATRSHVSFEPAGLVLPLNKWSRIQATYDRSFVTILVDTGQGLVERLRKAETHALVPSREERLYLGGGGGAGTAAFRGGVDDMRIDGILGATYEPFPADVRVLGPSRRIYYRDGRLDSTRHTRPETIVLTYGARRKEIVIGLEGTVTSK